MKVLGIIPARYNSSRFPGKPIHKINGKPMIWWVYQQAIKVNLISDVIVATDNDLVINVCNEYGIHSILTDTCHPTGTDRVCEISEKIKADLYVNIQGDEPIIEPHTIEKVIEPFSTKNNIQVVNLMTEIKRPIDIINYNIPKVVTDNNNWGIFLSRSPIPYPKNHNHCKYYRQLGIYGFTPEALAFFKKCKRGKNEMIEDIEILRFIEYKFPVYFRNVVTKSISVDTKNDLFRVEEFLKNDYNS